MATYLFHLGPHHCLFQFFSFLNYSTIYYFCQFFGSSTSGAVLRPKTTFFGHERFGDFIEIVLAVVLLGVIFLMRYHVRQNEDHMTKLRPREVGCPTNPNGAHKILVLHLLRLGFWLFRVLSYFK